jgi:RNA polymerase sigma-70 factor (ECF subfamily)
MHSFDDDNDLKLVARSQAGDREALEILTRRYLRSLYTVAVRMLGDPRAAREATHTAVAYTHRLLLARHRDRFFHAAHRLVVEECLDVLARQQEGQKEGQKEGSPAAGSHGAADTGSDPAEEAARFRALTFDERRHRLQAAILQLPADRRAVLILRHVAGLSYNETAITLDLSRERVRVRLHAARQQLGVSLLAWPSSIALPAGDEALLQDAIDGELDYDDRAARDRLLAEHPEAHARAAALRDLGHLLNSIGPAEPPPTLATAVLEQILD